MFKVNKKMNSVGKFQTFQIRVEDAYEGSNGSAFVHMRNKYKYDQ